MHVQDVLGILFTFTALASYINYRYVKLPKSIGLTLIALIMSLLLVGFSKIGWREQIDYFAHTLLTGIGFNETFLHVMLGFLLFSASLHVNTMELAKHKTIIGLLATLSVVLSTFMVGIGTYYLCRYLNVSLPLEYCLVFGALISPTDPIAVLGILKTVHAPKSLEMKIAGEALFNDGMGIVLFTVLSFIASGQQSKWSASEVVLFFMQQKLGGIFLGAFLGWAAVQLLQTIKDAEVAIIVTLALVTGGYAFAHSVAKVSGPICMAMAGLTLGSTLKKSSMSKDVLRQLDTFWELVDSLLNAILFVVIGLEFLRLSFNFRVSLVAFGAIFIAIASRWVSVIIPVALLSTFRRFSPNIVLLMTWGGLRGGLSIALALTLPNDASRNTIVAITYVVVIFSITVQGLSIGPLVRKMIGKSPGSSII